MKTIFDSKDFAIGGKMIKASVQISEFDMEQCKINNNASEEEAMAWTNEKPEPRILDDAKAEDEEFERIGKLK